MKEAIKCLVNESPRCLLPLPDGPQPVNVYQRWFVQGQGCVTRLVGFPASHGIGQVG